MADVDLLDDPKQLAEDAEVLDAWADCGESAGGRMAVIRRAAAACREMAQIVEYQGLTAAFHAPFVTCAPELLLEDKAA